MKKLYFPVNWGVDKTKAWSGTNYSLFKALSNYYQVIDIPLQKISYINKVLKRIFPNLFNDLSVRDIKNDRNYVLSQLDKTNTVALFQFAEIIDNKDFAPTYIYQDMSVSYLRYLYENIPENVQYSGFGNVPFSSIKKREISQNSYYATCSGIFTMGRWFREFLVTEGGVSPEKVHHVGGGINLDKSLIQRKEEKRRDEKILFVGRDFKRKGGEITYKAFKLLKSQLPNIELHIAGPSTHPISNPIEGCYFYGDLTPKELSDLFNKCDIFCMPSYYEAYGLVFIEALCYGLPCIGRDAYEMKFFIEDEVTGLLLKNDSAEELAGLMKRLLQENAIKDNVIKKREYYLETYSWDKVAERINKIIK